MFTAGTLKIPKHPMVLEDAFRVGEILVHPTSIDFSFILHIQRILSTFTSTCCDFPSQAKLDANKMAKSCSILTMEYMGQEKDQQEYPILLT